MADGGASILAKLKKEVKGDKRAPLAVRAAFLSEGVPSALAQAKPPRQFHSQGRSFHLPAYEL